MPNTAKSQGLYPHAYASAREKLPRHHQQSRQQQRSNPSTMYDAPQSTRPFMTMTAASALQPPIAHSQATSTNNYYHHHHHQHLREQTGGGAARRHLAHQLPSSSSGAYNSNNSYTGNKLLSNHSGRHQISPSAAAPYTVSSSSSNQQQQAYSSSRAMDADRVYEKLQPPAASMTRPSAAPGGVSAAWRDEIELRARAMERSSGVGIKRPAPSSSSSSSSSQRPVYQYETESNSNSSSSSGFPPAPSSGFRVTAPFTPPAPATTALPTLSYLLQRNSDASSSAAASSGATSARHSSILMMNDNQNQFSSSSGGEKRQRMFASLAAQPAASTVSLPPSRAHAQAEDLAGVNNDHLRKILEKEVAFYNQRNSQYQYQNPPAAALSASRYYDGRRAGAEDDDEAKSPAIYTSNNNNNNDGSSVRKPAPTYYCARPSVSSSFSYSRGNTVDSPLMGRQSELSSAESCSPTEQQAHMDDSPPPRRQMFSKRIVNNNNTRTNNRSTLSHISSEVPLRYNNATTTMSAVSDDSNSNDSSPRELLDRDIPDRSSSSYVGGGQPELSSLRSRSPPPVALSERRPYTLNMHHQSSNQRYDSTPTGTSSLHDETDVSTPIRNNTMSSNSRTSSFRYSSSSSNHGESAIEAASGLLEERSPSKRESITKLLLKSKEFLKAKSLVRNRNNEIDWVATFLNVGFESSSIYSLMCPLRKGRWKAEEEKYTMELLRLIESGTIRLRHGQSIRGFIAKKLHSDDMRVLKKLSNCKMFHFARMITPHMSEEEEIDEGVAGASAGLSRLEKLRSEFLRSVQLEALVAVRKYLSDSSIRELLNSRG